MASVLDLAASFGPTEVGTALARLWAVEGAGVTATLDPDGSAGGAPECPITLDRIKCPVLLSDGKVYEEESILRWLRTSDRAPTTNLPLPHRRVLRLAPFRGIIEAFLRSSSLVGGVCPLFALARSVEECKATRGRLQPWVRLESLQAELARAVADGEDLQQMIFSAQQLAAQVYEEIALSEARAAASLQSAARRFLARLRWRRLWAPQVPPARLPPERPSKHRAAERAELDGRCAAAPWGGLPEEGGSEEGEETEEDELSEELEEELEEDALEEDLSEDQDLDLELAETMEEEGQAQGEQREEAPPEWEEGLPRQAAVAREDFELGDLVSFRFLRRAQDGSREACLGTGLVVKKKAHDELKVRVHPSGCHGEAAPFWPPLTVHSRFCALQSRSASLVERAARFRAAGHCCGNCRAAGCEVNLFFCSACNRVGYCSQVCQVEDWARHQHLCRRL